ncbi:MAG: hypothetical protein ABIS50_24275 [Luteolibacter sp.]|uniref:hypothetical protein n=1 Tax=Luteolibacter sp. TaxID=1962973 RepID=UPI0032662BB8
MKFFLKLWLELFEMCRTQHAISIQLARLTNQRIKALESIVCHRQSGDDQLSEILLDIEKADIGGGIEKALDIFGACQQGLDTAVAELREMIEAI